MPVDFIVSIFSLLITIIWIYINLDKNKWGKEEKAKLVFTLRSIESIEKIVNQIRDKIGSSFDLDLSIEFNKRDNDSVSPELLDKLPSNIKDFSIIKYNIENRSEKTITNDLIPRELSLQLPEEAELLESKVTNKNPQSMEIFTKNDRQENRVILDCEGFDSGDRVEVWLLTSGKVIDTEEDIRPKVCGRIYKGEIYHKNIHSYSFMDEKEEIQSESGIYKFLGMLLSIFGFIVAGSLFSLLVMGAVSFFIELPRILFPRIPSLTLLASVILGIAINSIKSKMEEKFYEKAEKKYMEKEENL